MRGEWLPVTSARRPRFYLVLVVAFSPLAFLFSLLFSFLLAGPPRTYFCLFAAGLAPRDRVTLCRAEPSLFSPRSLPFRVRPPFLRVPPTTRQRPESVNEKPNQTEITERPSRGCLADRLRKFSKCTSLERRRRSSPFYTFFFFFI